MYIKYFNSRQCDSRGKSKFRIRTRSIRWTLRFALVCPHLLFQGGLSFFSKTIVLVYCITSFYKKTNILQSIIQGVQNPEFQYILHYTNQNNPNPNTFTCTFAIPEHAVHPSTSGHTVLASTIHFDAFIASSTLPPTNFRVYKFPRISQILA